MVGFQPTTELSALVARGKYRIGLGIKTFCEVLGEALLLVKFFPGHNVNVPSFGMFDLSCSFGTSQRATKTLQLESILYSDLIWSLSVNESLHQLHVHENIESSIVN